ncbi:MAG: hypothetical protein J7L90_02915 [Dehalococcoidia bacterium]|nr:hypothetical protein [Dehalococcoidia bacterium]
MATGKEIDIQLLREDLIGELEAINQYQDHLDDIESDEAAKVLEHIMADEKEHVAELMKIIQEMDTQQAEKFKKKTP